MKAEVAYYWNDSLSRLIDSDFKYCWWPKSSFDKIHVSRAMRKYVLCHMRTTKAQISLRIRAVWASVWSVLAVRMKNVQSLATHWVHSEDQSARASTKADQNLRWAHSHFVGFKVWAGEQQN